MIKTTYNFIDENRRRTIFIVLLFPVVFALLAYATIVLVTPFIARVEDSGGALYNAGTLAYANYFAAYVIPAAVGAALLWILISYFIGGNMMLSSAGAVEVTRDNYPEIYNLADIVAIAAGLPTPKIYLIPDASLNAFATGRDPRHAAIALTQGIVERLDRRELQTVIGHEMSHIKNRDIRLMLIIVAGIAFFSFAGGVLLRIRAKKQAAVILLAAGLLCLVYGYLIAPLIRFAVSRQREFQADATSALLTRDPAALASALEKISHNSVVNSLSHHEAMAAMCIESPLKKAGLFSSLSGLYATHPPTEDRIKALRAMDGRF